MDSVASSNVPVTTIPSPPISADDHTSSPSEPSPVAIHSVTAAMTPSNEAILVDWSYTLANNSSPRNISSWSCLVPFQVHMFTDELATSSNVSVVAAIEPSKPMQTGHVRIDASSTIPLRFNHTYTFQIVFPSLNTTTSPTMQDHMCSWVTTSHLSSSSLNSTPLVWPLQASTRSDDSLATDNTTSWLLFLGALGVLFVLFVLRLLVFHMFLRQNNLDPFATLPPTELDLEQPSSSRRRLPHRPTGIQKNTTSQSKRALKLIASAADSGAPPSPHLAMQIKLYNGEYHPEVERMAKAIVAIEKQSQLDHKNRLRDQLRHADVLGHHLSSAERQHTKHQAFVIHLHDGIELQMLHVRKPSVKPMVVYANDNLTTIKWQVARKPSTKEFVNGGAHTLHFVDVQSIAPWTNELPPLFEAKYRHLLKDGADEHCFYAVLVVYLHAKKRTKQKHLLLQAKDIDDQTHLADTLAKLVASAKRRRDSPVTTPLPPAAAVVVAEPTNIVAATPTIGDE